MKASTLISAGIGFIAGVFITKQIQSRPITPEHALNNVKRKVSTKVSGSWIYTIKEPLEINELSYNVYKGGFTRTESTGNEHFLFTVDADTGAILEVSSTNV